MNTKKKLLILSLLIIIVGGYIAYSYYNKPHRDIEKEKATLEVSAVDIMSEFETNEKSANEKYLNNVVLVEGKIRTITPNSSGANIVLQTKNPMFGISCSMLPKYNTDIEKIKENDIVKIKGKCDGFIDDVVLSKSSIIKVKK